MYSLLSISKHLILISILAVVAVQLLLTHSVSCLNMTNAYIHHKCYITQGKYEPGSEYEEHLTSIAQTISSTKDLSKGYVMMGFTGDGIFVSVIVQCRGDSHGPKCHSCYATALSGLRRRCPKYKGGIVWYEHCLLEFSGNDTQYQNDYDNNFCMHNPKNVSDDQVDVNNSFNRKWTILLSNLTRKAIKIENNDLTPLYAAGERNFGKYKIYGMVQCTLDITIKGCQECIGHNMVEFQDCLYGKRGGRVLGRSCNFRFELYPFVPNSLKM
ncbi:hypothetical protein AALP_AA2G008600 [Arabis alpina]|uniref:Gnk2-homologous domain-containing protein n=1 Tax=Arabis alpina TaxID=50452 RepID=A0A087HEI5_ARAAL|nr:hypothetical protein AALP_AA2G008600 [Arabis alpina]